MLQMRYTKKNRRITKANNAIDPATSTSKNWGFVPVPGKGGATTNFVIPEWMFAEELKYMKEGDINA
jgi:hypothetical protein